MNTHDTPLEEILRILAADKAQASVRARCAGGDHRWTRPLGVRGLPKYCARCGIPKELFEQRQKEAKP